MGTSHMSPSAAGRYPSAKFSQGQEKRSGVAGGGHALQATATTNGGSRKHIALKNQAEGKPFSHPLTLRWARNQSYTGTAGCFLRVAHTTGEAHGQGGQADYSVGYAGQ
jgi:hypothetical protein